MLSWSDEDRAKLIAWLYESASRCSSCGTAPWEWEEDKYAYRPQEIMCHGCYLSEIASESETTDRTPGSRIVLVPKGRR